MRFDPRATFILAVSFVTGLLAQVTVNVVGNLPVSEIVLLGLAGMLLVQTCVTGRLEAPLFRSPLFRIFIAAQAAALVGYIVSDFYRGSAPNDILRGWSRMAFLSIDIAMFAYLYGAYQRAFISTQIGGAFGCIVAVQLYGAQFDAYWKFAYGAPVTLLVFLLLPALGFWIGVLSIFALGVLHLVLDYRSLGGICLLAGVLLCVTRLPRSWRALTVLPALLGGIIVTVVLTQSRSDDDSTRGERSNVERTAMMEAAWEGFRESPWIGQGSWFSKSRVMDNFLLLRAEGAREAGVHGYSTESEEANLAIHSQLLVSIAEGGVIGGTFFVIFGLGLAWGIAYCTLWRLADSRNPVYLLTLLNSIWNLIFSPFSGTHRLIIAFSCGLLLILWRECWGKAAPEPESTAFLDETHLSPVPIS